MIPVHMACSLLSYLAFLVAFVAGMLFLVQERQLKRKHMGVLFRRLPSLDLLDRLNLVAIGLGFGLLTVGMGFGFLSVRRLLGRWWTGDPNELLTVTLWVGYLALWGLRLRTALRGRRVALLSVLGFGLVLFSLLGVSWWLPTAHPPIHPAWNSSSSG